MKDYTEKEINEGRPGYDALHCVEFCLNCLYKDNKHTFKDTLTERLTYEELLGALLQAKDELETKNEEE